MESSMGSQRPVEKKVDVNDQYLFGSVLRAVREARKKKRQEDIAGELNVTPGSVFGWEKGFSFPEPERLGDIARAYDISLKQLKATFQTAKEARDLANIARSGRIQKRNLKF